MSNVKMQGGAKAPSTPHRLTLMCVYTEPSPESRQRVFTSAHGGVDIQI